MNVKETLQFIAISIPVFVAGYTIALKAGFIVNDARASEIAREEFTPESVERMEFQLEYKLSELRRYYALEHRSPSDIVQINELEAQVAALRTRIAKARKQQ